LDYIGENNLAFDPGALGFPSIMGCQAICLHTSRGLYGFHDYKSGKQGGRDDMTPLEVSNQKLSVFADWVTDKKADTEEMMNLYGVINRGEQYAASSGGNAGWKSVLVGLANSLKFTGPVYGARINSHIATGESAYVQFDLLDSKVAVGFKRWSKMGLDNANKVVPDDQSRIVSRDGAFGQEDLYGSGRIAPVYRKDASKGFNLNRIAVKQFTKFQ
jgi:hypothetical protein